MMVPVVVAAATSGAAVEAYREGKSVLSWSIDLNKYYKKLIDQEKKLYSRRDTVQTEVDRDGTKQVTIECQTWIDRVRTAEAEEVPVLKEKYNKVKKSRLGWLRVWRCGRLSKRIAETCESLQNLWSEGEFDKVVVEKEPEPVRPTDAHTTEDKPTLHSTVEEILALLGDEKVRRVGLWGMVGTGKTVIMENLNDNEKTANMFDLVILIKVTKNLSVKKMQDAILQRMKLNMEGTTDPDEIAWRISQKLKGMRYLFLLDDVCKEIDLRQIGVHSDHKDWKLVFTTRSHKICYDMRADQHIKVKPLSKHDAWKLFRESVGPNINAPGVREIAQKVAEYCAGYPLLLDKVAKSFRRKDNRFLWFDGWTNLQKWPSLKIEGMDEMVEFLEFCYEQLATEDAKICFLYGALYSEDYDIRIDHLLECWRAEVFINEANGLTVAHAQGYSILHDLIDVSFLEESEKMKHVRMNKVIRKMALKKSSQRKDCRFLVRVSEGLEKPPEEEEWKQPNRISLMDNKLCTLPPTPDCSNLSTLFLQKNSDLKEIPDPFFESMKKLLVLDLNSTGIESLPESLSSLTCLKVLYLHSCIHLMKLPCNIDALKCLEVLDIRGTGINHLPIEIGSLTRLRCLRMALSNFGIGGGSRREEIFQKVNLSIPSLEELSIDVYPYTQWWNQTVQVITEKVVTLSTLTSFSYCFPEVDCLKIFIGGPSRNEFHYTNGGGHHNSTRHLKIENGEGVDQAVSKLLPKSDVFELIGHKGAQRLSDFDIKYMNEMRVCSIESCSEIETIVDANGVTEGALKCLEVMRINNAPKLESIWEGPVPVGSLAGLTTLNFCNCSKLKKIFSNGMIQQLSKLQYLRVEECSEIEEIIMESENNRLEPGALPCLKTLELIELPRLRSIWSDDSLVWPSLERIEINDCQWLTSLPFNNGNANELQIKVQQSWWDALAWKDNAIKERLQSFCIFQ